MEFEYYSTLHKKYLEELKIIKTFKYSSIIGIIIAVLSKVISQEISSDVIVVTFYLVGVIYFIFNNQEGTKQNQLRYVEGKIKNIKSN